MTDNERETDWEGHPVPSDEPDDKSILVWEVSPHPQQTYSSEEGDVMWCRSWQEMLGTVGDHLEEMLEGVDREDLIHEGFAVKFRLRKVTVGQYREMVQDAGAS